MDLGSVVAVVVPVGLLGFYIALMVFGIFAGGMEIVQVYRMLRFRQVVRQKVTRCKMTYEDLKHIAALFRQGRAEILHSLRMAHGDTFVEQEADEGGRSHILGLMKTHEEEAPFAELPEHIGLQLVAIQAEPTTAPQGVPQLAKSLGDLYSKNRRELARQKNYSFLGFSVGLAGLVVGLYPVVFKDI